MPRTAHRAPPPAAIAFGGPILAKSGKAENVSELQGIGVEDPMKPRAHCRVPVANPGADLRELRDEVVGAITRVVDSGTYVLGSEVVKFETQFAARLRTMGAVGVGSGTDALVLGLLGAGVAPGDEVITVSYTAGPTVAAIHMTGAIPVFVDIDEDTYCLDPDSLEAAVSSRTKAILPVHLYGHPADLRRICVFAQQRGIAVIEDCAQAQEATLDGRLVGSIGDAGCFSFYPTKNLGALGDGGLVASIRPEIVQRVRLLRTYGWSRPQYSEIPNGRGSRLDEIQAAILNIKLDHLTKNINRRRTIAQRYTAAFADLPLILPKEGPGCRHAYHLYVIRSDRRDALARHLDRAGIATARHYPSAAHAQPGLAAGSRISQPLKTTETALREILSLPLYPSMGSEAQQRVIDGVRSFFEAR